MRASTVSGLIVIGVKKDYKILAKNTKCVFTDSSWSAVAIVVNCLSFVYFRLFFRIGCMIVLSNLKTSSQMKTCSNSMFVPGSGDGLGSLKVPSAEAFPRADF